MNSFEFALYFICFALITGGAFAVMWNNLQSINYEISNPPKLKHPEAPEVGDELLYVDFSREKLEELYQND
jgi:hypothetical protein